MLFSSLNLLTSAPRALAAGGDLDPTFSGNGKVTTQFPSGGAEASGVAIQADGKMIVAGGSGSLVCCQPNFFALARYNTDGTLDSTFGTDGEVETGFPGFEFSRAADVAIQPDGKIVAVGTVNDSVEDLFAIARYNSDGSLDTMFSGDGLQTTEISRSDSQANAVALQSDGKIIVAGVTYPTLHGSFALARYNPDGTFDATFSGNGKLAGSCNICFGANDVAIQTNGAIVIVGGSVLLVTPAVIARVLPDGSFDRTFSRNGRKAIDSGALGAGELDGVAIQQDGKIVAVGAITWYTDPEGQNPDRHKWEAVRVRQNGSLDPTFNGDGLVRFGFSRFPDDHAAAVAIQSNGKIDIAGDAAYPYGGINSCDGSNNCQFALARLRADGTLDLGFGRGDGKVLTRFGPLGSSASGADVAIPRGRIVVAGTGVGFAIARYLVH